MHGWDDKGILLSVTRYGEQSAVIRLLTERHGLCAGMAKGAFSKASRGIYQPGNLLHVQWQARLEEQLGQMRCELLAAHAAEIIAEPLRLHIMNAIGALVLACVPERVDENKIYNNIMCILSLFNSKNEYNSLSAAYARFELVMLEALGFGLDLSGCAATGRKEDLVYVSPKSGRAVCREAGAPYHAKMLPLPDFLQNTHSLPEMPQILDGLALTGYFLETWLLQPEGKPVPAARQELLRHLSKVKS